MVYSAAAGMVNAVRETCAEADYTWAAEAGESGCGDGPLERRSQLRRRGEWNATSPSLEKRLPPSDPGSGGQIDCDYSVDMCTGPRVISKCKPVSS